MKSVQKTAKFALIAGTVTGVLLAQADSRMAEISAQQDRKAQELLPVQQNKVESGLLRVDEDSLLDRISDGFGGFRLKFGSLATGSGFALGPEYRRANLM